MTKTLDEIVRDALGDLQFALCRLQAENEALRAKLAALEPAPPKES